MLEMLKKGGQPRSQGLFPGLGVGREKTLGSAGESFILIG